MEKYTIEIDPYVEGTWSIMVNLHRGIELLNQWVLVAHSIEGEVIFDYEEEPPQSILNFITETIKNR